MEKLITRLVVTDNVLVLLLSILLFSALFLVCKIIVFVGTIVLRFVMELREVGIGRPLMFIGFTVFLAGYIVTLSLLSPHGSAETVSIAGIGAIIAIFAFGGMVACRRRQRTIANGN